MLLWPILNICKKLILPILGFFYVKMLRFFKLAKQTKSAAPRKFEKSSNNWKKEPEIDKNILANACFFQMAHFFDWNLVTEWRIRIYFTVWAKKRVKWNESISRIFFYIFHFLRVKFNSLQKIFKKFFSWNWVTWFHEFFCLDFC